MKLTESEVSVASDFENSQQLSPAHPHVSVSYLVQSIIRQSQSGYQPSTNLPAYRPSPYSVFLTPSSGYPLNVLTVWLIPDLLPVSSSSSWTPFESRQQLARLLSQEC